MTYEVSIAIRDAETGATHVDTTMIGDDWRRLVDATAAGAAASMQTRDLVPPFDPTATIHVHPARTGGILMNRDGDERIYGGSIDNVGEK